MKPKHGSGLHLTRKRIRPILQLLEPAWVDVIKFKLVDYLYTQLL